MSNTDWHKLLHKKELTRKEFLALTGLAFISLFGVVGVISELLSRAATPYASGEAETGTRGGITALTATTGSASSEVVQFGAPTTSGGGGGGSTTPAYPPPGGVGTLLFNSDFSTMANASNTAGSQWGIINGNANNNVSSTPTNVAIVDGQLVLTLSSDSVGAEITTCPASWDVYTPPSNGGFTFTYGYVECSFVVPAGGWWAVWLDGQQWPNDGEFDICENLGASFMTTNYWHGSGSGTGTRIGNYSTQPSAGEVVTVGGLWQQGAVASYLNGKQMAQATASYVSADPQFLLLNIGYSNGYSSPGDQLKVNYMRVWGLP
jgi:hypothetical protein